MERFKIKVPGTSANLGLGFDSMGLALTKFLTIEARPAESWKVEFLDEALEVLPSDDSNLVCQTAMKVAELYGKTMPSLLITMGSEIPLTHGQGSSSSAIVAGIELANHYLSLNLSDFDKISIGSQLEGHPDNIGPCVTGDVFVGYYEEDGLFYEVIQMKDIGLIVTTPGYEISTAEARKALPEHYDKSAAIRQNAANNVMLLAMAKGDYAKMGQLMMKDQFHEIYRSHLIPEFSPLRDLGQNLGAYATVISGAGPSILTLTPLNQVEKILQGFEETYPELEHERQEIYTMPS